MGLKRCCAGAIRKHGLIPQDRFIPLGGHNGLNRANLQLGVGMRLVDRPGQWQQQGLGLDMISVNWSPRQFDPSRCSRFGPFALDESGLPSEDAGCGITESGLDEPSEQGEQDTQAVERAPGW